MILTAWIGTETGSHAKRLGRCHLSAHVDEAVEALLLLRAEIVRDGRSGLSHVDALLALRGRDPDGNEVDRLVARFAGRGTLKTQLVGFLSEGPRTLKELVARVQQTRPNADEHQTYHSTANCLTKLRRSGVAVTEAGRWRLTR